MTPFFFFPNKISYFSNSQNVSIIFLHNPLNKNEEKRFKQGWSVAEEVQTDYSQVTTKKAPFGIEYVKSTKESWLSNRQQSD